MSEWISVKNRLPDYNLQSIIAYGEISGVEEVSVTWLRDFENDITHWMPLPDPPEDSV